jgi:hypothetical protein
MSRRGRRIGGSDAAVEKQILFEDDRKKNKSDFLRRREVRKEEK